jgi:hypothetical protein
MLFGLCFAAARPSFSLSLRYMAMIYTESDDKKTDYGAVSQRDVQPVAGPSQVLGYDEGGDNSPPPPFQDYQEQTQPEHVLIDFGNTNVLIPAGGEEPPPAFTTYDAEFQLDCESIIIFNAFITYIDHS